MRDIHNRALNLALSIPFVGFARRKEGHIVHKAGAFNSICWIQDIPEDFWATVEGYDDLFQFHLLDSSSKRSCWQSRYVGCWLSIPFVGFRY